MLLLTLSGRRHPTPALFQGQFEGVGGLHYLEVRVSVQVDRQPPDSLDELGRHLFEIHRLLYADSTLGDRLGPATFEGARSLCAAFRQRFPQQWPGSQQPLF